MNFDNSNRDRIKPLIDYFASLGLQDKVLFGFNWVFTDVRLEKSYDDKIISGKAEAADVVYELITYAQSLGFGTNLNNFDGPCMIHSHTSLSMDPVGNLYSCPGATGISKYAWGNVVRGTYDETKHLEM